MKGSTVLDAGYTARASERYSYFDKEDQPLARERYGRGIPGGDFAILCDDLAHAVLAGTLTYEEAQEQAAAKKGRGGGFDGAAVGAKEFRSTYSRVKQVTLEKRNS